MKGFNVGVIVSLGDMELALDYLNDESSFEPDIDTYKKERMAVRDSLNKNSLTEDMKPNQAQEIEEPEEVELEAGDLEVTDTSEDEDNLDSLIAEAMDEDSEELDLDEDSDEESEDDDELDIEEDDTDLDEDDSVDSDEIEIDIDEDELGYDEDTDGSEESEEDSDTEEEFDLDELAESVDAEEEEPVQPTKLTAPGHTRAEIELERKLEQAKAMVQQRVAEQRQREEQQRKKTLEVQKTERELELERQLQEALEKLKQLESNTTESTEIPKQSSKHIDKPTQKPIEARRPPIKRQESHVQGVVGVDRTPTQPAVKKQVAPHSRPELTNEQVYAAMDIKALYIEVKRFLDSKGVSKSAVDRSLVDQEFGVSNVNRLIMQSYLISLGKRITIGK